MIKGYVKINLFDRSYVAQRNQSQYSFIVIFCYRLIVNYLFMFASVLVSIPRKQRRDLVMRYSETW